MVEYLLAFHGLGSDPSQLEKVGNLILDQANSKAKLVCIQGSRNFGTEEKPYWGWFEPPEDSNRDFLQDDAPEYSGIESSIHSIHSEVNRIRSAGVRSEHIHFIGHSQGGAIALAASLSYPHRLGSVSTIAGYLALTPQIEIVGVGTPYYLHHCLNDDNVSFHWADYARRNIQAHGENCHVIEYPVTTSPHSVQLSQLRNIAQTLQTLS